MSLEYCIPIASVCVELPFPLIEFRTAQRYPNGNLMASNACYAT